MKTLRLLSLLIVAAIMFSCEKDVNEEKTGEVSFGISHLDLYDLKDGAVDPDWPYCPDDMVPVKAEIEINGVTYTPEVFYLSGELYTQAIRLATGTYNVTKFVILNAANEIIMATPETGAEFAEFITAGRTVDFNITVGEFTKTEVEVEVLCFMEHYYQEFGFNWFLIHEIIVREMCFFGDLCHKDPGFYAGTIYDDVFNLSDYPFDLPALFEVVVLKGQQRWEYTNYDMSKPEGERFIAPLCVQYPDLIRVDGEEFTFELYIYVPVGDGVQKVLFDSWTLTEVDGELDWSELVNDFNVVEFVVGSCNYVIDGNVIVYPPWQNLPEKTNAALSYKDYDISGYWELTINSVFPVATKYDFPVTGKHLGWCGDPNQVITNATHNFFVYGSLSNANWPDNMPVGLGDLAAVNWLFNNLHLYFDIDPIDGIFMSVDVLDLDETEAKDLQHAIWLALGFTQAQFPGSAQGGGTASQKAIDMAADARGNLDFVPLPGGWAAVLMVKDENGTPKVDKYQLIFTMVDP